MERKIFVGLFALFILSTAAWYIFIDTANSRALKKINQDVDIISAKVKNARHAQMDYSNVQKKYEEDQKRLIQERTRFVNKNDLSDVTYRLQKFAADYQLKLMDFSPELQAYFAASPEDKIVPLPIVISVNGGYLDTGKFLENWYQLPFYLIPEEITIERIEEGGNELKSTTTASLYTWNE